jgi:DNA-binding FrmR family transcriptional regulator
VAGQVRGLEALVEQGATCDQLLTQLKAVQGALEAVSRIVEVCRAVEQVDRAVGPLNQGLVRQALQDVTARTKGRKGGG